MGLQIVPAAVSKWNRYHSQHHECGDPPAPRNPRQPRRRCRTVVRVTYRAAVWLVFVILIRTLRSRRRSVVFLVSAVANRMARVGVVQFVMSVHAMPRLNLYVKNNLY